MKTRRARRVLLNSGVAAGAAVGLSILVVKGAFGSLFKFIAGAAGSVNVKGFHRFAKAVDAVVHARGPLATTKDEKTVPSGSASPSTPRIGSGIQDETLQRLDSTGTIDNLRLENQHLRSTCESLKLELRELRQVVFERDHIKAQHDRLISTAAAAQARAAELEAEVRSLQWGPANDTGHDHFHPSVFKPHPVVAAPLDTASQASYGRLSTVSEPPRKTNLRQLFRSWTTSATNTAPESLPATPCSSRSEAPPPNPHQVMELLESFGTGH